MFGIIQQDSKQLRYHTETITKYGSHNPQYHSNHP